MNSKKSIYGHLSALFTIIVWGTTFISTKILLKDLKPVDILFLRFVIGYIALILVYPHFIKSKNIREELLFAAAGLFGITLYFLMENVALTYTLASNVGVIVSVSPFFTAVIAHFIFKTDSLHSRFFVGFVVAMLGILLIDFNGSFVLKLNPLGDILAVLASLCWAVYTNLMRKISSLGYNNIACTRRSFFYGLILMLPVLSITGFHPNLSSITNITDVGNILFLSLCASALCFGSWNWSVKVLGAVKTSIYIYIVPVITVAASFIILHEHITAAAIFGTLLTLAGLLLSEKKAPAIKTNNNIAS